MILQILKTVVAGILAGVALFMIPFFLIKILLFVMLISAAFRLMGWRRRHGYRYAYAHKYKNMSEEERANFKRQCGFRHEEWMQDKSASNDDTTTSTTNQ